MKEFNFTKRQWRAVFAYLFREIGVMDLRRQFRGDGIEAKRKIDSSGYILLNCKLFIAANQRGRASYREYGIAKEDAAFLRTIRVDCGDYKIWGLQEFKQEVENQLFCKEMGEYIGKFISKKLIFLRSYGLNRSDLETELNIAGLYAVYRAYPFYDSDTHIGNVAKMAIKNRGHELITIQTRQKNQSLRRLADGTFESMLVPYHLAGLESEVSKSVNTNYYEKLAIAYNKSTPRAKHFIKLLMGEPDEQFSRFLGTSNSRAFERMPTDKYIQSVRSHLRISENQCERFFAKIQRL